MQDDLVIPSGSLFYVPVGSNLLGRVVDCLGNPIDGEEKIAYEEFNYIEAKAPGIITRKSVHEAMQTGILCIDSAISKYLANSARKYRFLQTIEEVEISGVKAKVASHRDHPGLSTLPAQADHTIDVSQIEPCRMLSECLRYKLTGVVFYENKFYVARDFNAGQRIPMLIYVNGLMYDFESLNTINAGDIVNIEIFLKDEIGQLSRSNGTNGIIVINTKPLPKGSKETLSADEFKKLFPESFVVTYKPKGYAVEREFYVPKYSADPAALNFSDLRSTVYWNPKLMTNDKGQAVVEFFNADGRGSYKAILEGTDAKGNIARTVFRYTVK
ncbi:MAG: hypothetical protein EOP48_12935 [Sphingobacteriales bacterium]|nr:MAG: hypothetical protein EOP48_12935 [Sphingobacteriales bacterium]